MPGKNYVQQISDELTQLLPDCDQTLIGFYTLLGLEFGTRTDLVMVHNAWAVWRNLTNPAHKSLIPFPFLSPEVQALDQPYVDAIHEAIRRVDALNAEQNGTSHPIIGGPL